MIFFVSFIEIEYNFDLKHSILYFSLLYYYYFCLLKLRLIFIFMSALIKDIYPVIILKLNLDKNELNQNQFIYLAPKT